MAPEHEVRERTLYDHESDPPRRRRRPAADWGVGEDIFDRMPSRFARRGEHRDEIVLHRAEDERPSRSREVASWGEDAWADDAPAPRDARVQHDASREDARDTWGDEDRAPRHGTARVTRDASWGDEDRAHRHGTARV